MANMRQGLTVEGGCVEDNHGEGGHSKGGLTGGRAVCLGESLGVRSLGARITQVSLAPGS